MNRTRIIEGITLINFTCIRNFDDLARLCAVSLKRNDDRTMFYVSVEPHNREMFKQIASICSFLKNGRKRRLFLYGEGYIGISRDRMYIAIDDLNRFHYLEILEKYD